MTLVSSVGSNMFVFCMLGMKFLSTKLHKISKKKTLFDIPRRRPECILSYYPQPPSPGFNKQRAKGNSSTHTCSIGLLDNCKGQNCYRVFFRNGL